MNIKIQSNIIKAIIELEPRELDDLESLLVSIVNLSSVSEDDRIFAENLLHKLDGEL